MADPITQEELAQYRRYTMAPAGVIARLLDALDAGEALAGHVATLLGLMELRSPGAMDYGEPELKTIDALAAFRHHVAAEGGGGGMNEHMRYLGCLGLLAECAECAVYVPEDLREMIEQAMVDACAANPSLRWKRILDRFEIEVASFR